MTGDKPNTEPGSEAGEGEVQIAVEVDTGDGDDGSVEVPASDEQAAAGEAEAAPTDPLASLRAQVAELEEQKKQTYERLLRTTADFDNFRKRSKRDLEEARTDAKTRVLREMLPVIDNLERALEHAGGVAGNGAAGILDGVKLVLRQFSQALEKCDVVGLESLGQPFDPNLHEAIGQIETADYEPGACAQVLQRGYKIGNRLLRPALVVVAKAAAAPAESGGNGADGSEAESSTAGDGGGSAAGDEESGG